MSKTTIRIVAAVLDTANLTMYKENGDKVILGQGDVRIRPIVDIAAKGLLKPGDVVEVDITKPINNRFADFEDVSSGAVKLFRISKNKLKDLFKPVEPVSLGTIPNATPVSDHIASAGIYDVSELDEAEAAMEQAPTQLTSAIDDIMKHAVPVKSAEYHEDTIAQQGNIVEEDGTTNKNHGNNNEPDTIIAVVDNKIIPGMEKIKSQFAHAAKLGSTQGVENFLKRIASVIDKRKHSIEDLLKFMERGDLPIADDGSIIIYKILKRSGDKYVDCHSKKVQQWVGAFVCMNESLVDQNRRNECSNGLHVARRGYLGSFGGDICVLAKLAPEDVIAVPEYDANKMRVCGYHIIKELPDNLFGLLKSNKPMTSTDEGKRILAEAIAGKHTRKTHEVRITQHYGGGVETSDIAKADLVLDKVVAIPEKIKPIEALTNNHEEVAPTINPNDVAKQVVVSRKDRAKELYTAWINFGKSEEAFDKLMAFKKASKSSWDKLGIPDPTQGGSKANAKTKGKKQKAKPVKKVVVKSKPAVGISVATAASQSEGSPKDRIAKLLTIGMSKEIAQKVYEIKKASKKSWEVLGVTTEVAAQIMFEINK